MAVHGSTAQEVLESFTGAIQTACDADSEHEKFLAIRDCAIALNRLGEIEAEDALHDLREMGHVCELDNETLSRVIDHALANDSLRPNGAGIHQDAKGALRLTPARPAPIRWIDTAAWDDTAPPDREWAVFNRVPLRQAALFSGEGAAGKSTVLLHLCAAHAAGRDWLGSMPEPGCAFFIEAEDEAGELHRRAAAICSHYGARFSELFGDRLRLKSWAGEDAIIAAPNRLGRIEPTSLYDALLEEASDIKPKMIGLASSANIYAGSEIDRSQVQQFAGLLTRLAIAAAGSVVLASHPSLVGINTGSGLSGSTQWHNAFRSRFFMRTPAAKDDDEPDSDLREIQFKKNQYGPLGETLILRYQNGMFLPEPAAGNLEKLAREATMDDMFITLLRRCTVQGRNVSHTTSPTYAPSVFSREADAIAMKATVKELVASMGRAFAGNRIKVCTYGPPSKQRSRIEEVMT